MATSYPMFKTDVANFLKNNFNNNATILDVGAGCGTYYNYLHDYFKNMDAVEVFKLNIERYNLTSKYRNVYNENIVNFKYDFYDIIIFGDILEHLTVEEAQAVLKYACNRCKQVIVAVPYMYPQGMWEDNVYEIHRQPDLTKENVLERYPQLKLLYGDDKYGYYIKK